VAGLQYPRVPGHEIAGRIDALGDNVTPWQKVNASASVGMAGTVLCASRAVVVTLPCASIERSRASTSTVVMLST